MINNKIAVVLLNLGGPDSLNAVQPFLYNLFCDPDIFKIPVGQKLFAKFISKLRAPKVTEEYKLIGGNSPINYWTELQKEKLQNKLNDVSNNFKVFVAMRYWNPLIKDVAKEIESSNFEKVILLPLYPHYSITTTGSSFNEWHRYFNSNVELIKVNSYQKNKKYIQAINQRINESLNQFDEKIRSEVQLVFSAHGTPLSLVKNGDPYFHHINETVNEVMKLRNNSHEYHLCFQSKVGPMKWLEPSTDKMIENLANKNKRHLLIIPISFVSDHIETLFELNIEYRHVAEKVGILNYVVMEGLNDSDIFIDALTELVLDELK
ncbi:MAG: ferrochelatase [Melioribacteraceae bacterium]|nr:ferrochelatase [Melioribacteraceae bacterium]